jgi:predicted small integral membrane protein
MGNGEGGEAAAAGGKVGARAGAGARARAIGGAMGRLGTPPGAAAALTGTVALYALLVAFGNITDFGTNQEFVRHVLAMDTTFKDEDLMWRAIRSHPLQDAVYVCIILWETLTALVLCTATVLWARATVRDPRPHQCPHQCVDQYADRCPYGFAGARSERARRASTLGLVMQLLLFGAGFIAVGGEWFAMWQSKEWNGLDAAIRNFTVAALALILVQLPARHARRPASPGAEPDSPAAQGS